MKVKLLIGSQAAYACIDSLHRKLDVRLEPGKSPSQSLRLTASEYREKAARLQRDAMLIEEAAYELEEQDKLKTKR